MSGFKGGRTDIFHQAVKGRNKMYPMTEYEYMKSYINMSVVMDSSPVQA